VSDAVQPIVQQEALDLAADLGFELGSAMAILGSKGDRSVITRPGAELLSVFEELGADAELIWIVASFGDTRNEEQTLAALRQWNDRNRPGAQNTETEGPGRD
jgi:hypothetical protein